MLMAFFAARSHSAPQSLNEKTMCRDFLFLRRSYSSCMEFFPSLLFISVSNVCTERRLAKRADVGLSCGLETAFTSHDVVKLCMKGRAKMKSCLSLP
jgi:hypothetical protein